MFQNSRFMRVVIVLLVLSSLFVLAKTVNEFKKGAYIGRDTSLQNTIVVSGEGEEFAKPDLVTFSFSVVEEKKTVADAQKVATEKSNKTIAFLKGEGIAEKDIKTTSYNIYPKYETIYGSATICTREWCPPNPGKQIIMGYEVSQSIEVKVRDLEKAGELLSGIGSLGVSNVSGLTFDVEKKEEVQAKARAEAITDAKKKAEVLADDLGVSLVRIASFSENGYTPTYYGRGGVISMKADGAFAPAPEIPMGENKFISNVTITYEIR